MWTEKNIAEMSCFLLPFKFILLIVGRVSEVRRAEVEGFSRETNQAELGFSISTFRPYIFKTMPFAEHVSSCKRHPYSF